MASTPPNKPRNKGTTSPPHAPNMSASDIETLSRTPPHDTAAEQAVLGAMMMAASVADDVTELITGPDFYDPKHERIYDTIVFLLGSSRVADVITVNDELTKRGELSLVGGPVYLHDLLSSVSVAANAPYYAGIVRDHALRRRVIGAGIKATQLGYDGHGEVEDIADEAQQVIYAATDDPRRQATPVVGSLLAETYDWLESPDTASGVMTGFEGIDRLTGGLQPGQMVIVAARPGVGKSTFAMDIARHAAIVDRVPTLFVSLEMSKHEMMLRILASQGGVSLNALRDRKLNDDQWQHVHKASQKLSDAPLWLEDSPGITPLGLRSKARQMRRQGLGLILLDYIQLMSSGKKVESRQVEVSEFSRQIKLLGKELGVPVVALSQLNRSAEQRADRIPQLSDLRESGSLEQDADLVALLHRPELSDPQTTRMGEADVFIPKHRNGETGTVVLGWQGHFSRFVNLAPNSWA